MREALPFDRLVCEHYPLIARAALMLCGDPWEAEDLAQEVFLQAHRRYGSFVERAPVGAWLYGILRNLHRKSAARRRLAALPEAGPSPAADPLAELLRNETHAALWKGLAELDPKLREVLFLKYVEGLSQEAIGEMLALPIGTVKSRIGAGLCALRRVLGAVGSNEREVS
jgi:RNA polymerase sigma-70 factor (ECF subfamily)